MRPSYVPFWLRDTIQSEEKDSDFITYNTVTKSTSIKSRVEKGQSKCYH